MCSAPNEEYNRFLSLHRAQLETSCVPVHFWRTLFLKLRTEVLDAGATFCISLVEDEDSDEPSRKEVVISAEAVEKDDPLHIYLCDHAWTFRPNTARRVLESSSPLRKRLKEMMGLDTEFSAEILPHMWRYCQTYSLNAADPEDAIPIWYIMDEFASEISHSLTPNFRLIPFYYHPRQLAYSLLFPIEDVAVHEVVTRNYIECPPVDELTRKALLQPWFEEDMTDVDIKQVEPDEEFFLGGRHRESMPEPNGNINGNPFPVLPVRPKVFTEYSVLQENLQTDNRFEITHDVEEADIVWLNTHFKDFASFQREYPNKIINQFPFEHILTVKDLFSVVGRRCARPSGDDDELNTVPNWLPTSFNMMTELPKFVSFFQRRQAKNMDNVWIVKPFNLARSLDTYITDNLSLLMRLALTGPKMVSKYITNPVLFSREGIGRVKFDIRYCVLLRDVDPLRLYVYRNFWLRFANRPFSLDEFDVYEKHFTVMNYDPSVEMRNMMCSEFIELFENEYGVQWLQVEAKIFKALRELFGSACQLPPPRGIGYNPQSRAMYAVDLMLEWSEDGEMQPKLLELNWAPDCQRACEFYPTFFSDVFDALFKDNLSAQLIET